ncbi:MAG: hypothetical protein RSF90_07255, partial [Pygmaiobacter sp.]
MACSIAAAVLLCALGVAVVLYSAVSESKLNANVGRGAYQTAQMQLAQAPWLRAKDPLRADYIDAQVLLCNRQFGAAEAAFANLGGYGDSEVLAQRIKEYAAAEEDNPRVSFLHYQKLGGFLDSAQKAQALVPQVYQKGVALYEAGDYARAEWYFNAIAEHAPMYEQYRQLCAIERRLADEDLTVRERSRLFEALAAIEAQGEISIATLCMRHIGQFLAGEWQDAHGALFLLDDMAKQLTTEGLGLPDGRYRCTPFALL